MRSFLGNFVLQTIQQTNIIVSVDFFPYFK
uniref:Uncharacterized protein n=1 Tax=Lepeophtheirus salmonis TaxID=72036 RepID=A0A0K2T0X6_LEPSM